MAVNDDFLWFSSSPKELERHRGMHVAIWNKRIIGYGKTVKEAYEMAKGKEPDSDPALAYIPEDEAMVL